MSTRSRPFLPSPLTRLPWRRLPVAGPRLDRTLGGPPLVLEVDLTRGLLAAAPGDPVSALRARGVPTLAQVVTGLRRGARDPQVAAVVLQVASGALSVAQAEELGAALLDVSEKGTSTLAWAQSYGELSPGTVPYYLAAHCDQVWLQPSGTLSLTGVAVSITLLRGVLDKIGAEPQLGQRHEYKTAAEQLAGHEVSDANREMSQRLADSVVEQVRAQVRRARGLSEAELDTVLATAPLTADQALAARLVDRLGYRDEAYAHLRETVGRDGELRLQYASRYAAQHGRARSLSSRTRPVVAVVDVIGGIVSGRGGATPGRGPTAGSDAVGAALRAIAADDGVQAVVLRVDSPGGSYTASDAIRREVHVLRETGRPVVASMGTVAASGGYFVAMPADEVVALPGSLTGSIGVLGGKVVLRELADKVGLVQQQITAGEHAGMFSTLRHFDDAEWERVQEWLDLVYADFTAKAAQDRRLPLDRLEPMARGRVWTGADARERGLVDTLGGLQTAVAAACRRADLDREKVVLRRHPHLGLLDRLRPAESSESPVTAAAVSSAMSASPWTAALVEPLALGGDHPSPLLAALHGLLAPAYPGVLTLPTRLTLG